MVCSLCRTTSSSLPPVLFQECLNKQRQLSSTAIWSSVEAVAETGSTDSLSPAMSSGGRRRPHGEGRREDHIGQEEGGGLLEVLGSGCTKRSHTTSAKVARAFLACLLVCLIFYLDVRDATYIFFLVVLHSYFSEVYFCCLLILDLMNTQTLIIDKGKAF